MTDAKRKAILDSAVKNLKNTKVGYTLAGSEWRMAMEKINAVRKDLAPPALPNLGPVVVGGQSILDMDFTHLTTGLGWPAWDTALTGDPGPSTIIIAPERLVVDTKDSSSSPGEAIYCTGASRIRYWWAHLVDDHPLGKVFQKGDVIGRTLPTTVGGGTHLHGAINIIPITGRHARYGRDGDGPQYTHGPYTLRTELLRR